MKAVHETSDSLHLTLLLALSGGLMDAYSYVARGEVFANAQTGNIVLFFINTAAGEFAVALRYLLPLIAFATGIALASLLRLHFKNRPRFHWRQFVVLVEALVFSIAAFIPASGDLMANSLISLACGAQVESFRKLHHEGISIATTMCIGNLRNGIHGLCEHWAKHEQRHLSQWLAPLMVILVFGLGAVFGQLAVHFYGDRGILLSALTMLIAFIFMLNPQPLSWRIKQRRTR